MLQFRRLTALFAVGALALTLTNSGIGQVGKKGVGTQPPAISSGNASGFSSVKISEDSRFRQVINVGRDCIKDKEWKQAVEALQAVLNEPKDHYVQVHEQDAFDVKKESSRWTSVKFEANNLLGSMPKDGLETYEQHFGAEAKIKLDEAKVNGDRDLIAEVAQKYCHTKAGIEANEILATLYLARGQVFPAALRFEKLLQMNPEWAVVSDITLYKATIAFRRAGDTKNHDETWSRLKTNLDGKKTSGLKVGDEIIAFSKLDAVLKESPVIETVNLKDWPMDRGSTSRTAQAVGSPPLLDAPLWKRPLFKDKLDGFPDEDNDQAAYDRVTKAIKKASDANLAVLPGGFPIASQGIMVYRSPRDVRAISLKDMEIKTEDGEVIKIKAGEILWKTITPNRSLSALLDKAQTRNRVDPWLDSYHQIAGFDSFLYDNTTLGALCTDHRFVYAINDLAIPPHPGMFQINFNNPQQFQAQDLKPLLIQNELCAYDLQNGKLRWDLNNEKDDDPMFKNSHFLSLPISIGGKLYVLNERLIDPNTATVDQFGRPGSPIGGESELRLICIDPTKITNQKPTIIEPIQVLGNIVQFNRYVQDLPRRVNAVHLAYGEGVLVCPTNAGEVFGIDVMTRSLMWSYPYREHEHQMIVLPGMQFNPNPFGGKNPKTISTTTQVSKWKSSPPAIQDGRIVFTAPDADSVHCVNLRDGRPLWKRGQQKGDLYMAGVYQGRVLIVGDNKIRALDLKDGSRVWEIPTNDLPSGQGVASKGVYYLPLKKGEILAIDIAKGEVKAHNRAAVQGESPGNLVFYEGMVLSQTATEVMAYPQLTARLDIAKKAAAADPDDQVKMTDYGELLLKDGQVHIAVETLLKVHERKPGGALAKRVAERLFEALTDLMQVDFNKASKDYLTIYEGLTKVPDNKQEEQARKAKFFRLVGQGREAQGDLVTAFQMYKDFGALEIHRDVGITSPDDATQKIPINVWLRGRIAGMFSKATPQQRAPLEAKIAEEWKMVQAKDEGALRSFVGMFDVPFRVGREARVKLAESIMDRNERGNFLEAELILYQVAGSDFRTEAETGGRALAALAQLEEKKGTVDSMRLAAAYYRELARDFGGMKIRGEKTGVDLINDLAADKRFLPFLEETTSSWGPVKMASRELPENAFPPTTPIFTMQPAGDNTPFARQHRLTFSAGDLRLKLRDVNSGEDRWETTLGRVDMNQQIVFNLYQGAQPYHPNARFRFFHVKGHLIVCQIGVMIHCIDGDTGRELWKYQTAENLQQQNGFIQMPNIEFDAEGSPILIYRNQLTNQMFRVTLGRIGTAQASYVAILGHKGLTVRDPIRGTEMWRKTDVPSNSHAFGDDQYLFLVEVNENGAFGAGRTIRASDGETQNVPDFSNAYQARVRLYGRQILAAQGDRQNFTVRLYDILNGKDVWSKQFPAGSNVMRTEDPAITGVVEPNGKVTILDAQTGKALLESSVAQFRVGPQDLQGLKDVLLLQDSEHYYIALNKPVDRTKIPADLQSNFNNSTRCYPINGWFVALHKTKGQKKIGERNIAWKKGEMAWHSQTPLSNQMIVLEQFDSNPVLMFTVRYNELTANGGNRWMSVTQSIQKSSGTWVHESVLPINGQPMFSGLYIDMKSRTVNLMSVAPRGSIQHYVDDGKGPPAFPVGALNVPGDRPVNDALVIQPKVNAGAPGQPGQPGRPGFGGAIVLPPGGIQILPAQDVPERKR